MTPAPRLPDFVVAGVPRAGTSALGAQLRKLDDVYLPERKEPRTNHRGPVRSVRLSAAARRLPGPAIRAVRRWNTTPADYPDLRPATRERLEERFAPDRQELCALLGREVPWGHAVPR